MAEVDHGRATVRARLPQVASRKLLKQLKLYVVNKDSDANSITYYASGSRKLINRAAKTMFTVDGVDKKTKEREILGSFKGARRLTGLVGRVRHRLGLELTPLDAGVELDAIRRHRELETILGQVARDVAADDVLVHFTAQLQRDLDVVQRFLRDLALLEDVVRNAVRIRSVQYAAANGIAAAIEHHVKSGAEMVLYSVNAISGSTESQGEVTVRLQNSGRVVNGVGADPDIVVASAKAYINALNKLHSKLERVNPQV